MYMYQFLALKNLLMHALSFLSLGRVAVQYFTCMQFVNGACNYVWHWFNDPASVPEMSRQLWGCSTILSNI